MRRTHGLVILARCECGRAIGKRTGDSPALRVQAPQTFIVGAGVDMIEKA